ncbi:acetyl/propionyl/methylcrotonyl-CoA carboxylase subunit alpha [Stakelama saccharophila]|uniref:Acetyl/propionyl/methylcrotonyl-CoA carboxylase subunit alpha n=1 Tax=Stakelama saccharophila TaxID=3075605 RepID=A0ABZ0B6B2_9SPHN|nr:acetyl/propionyl/methylcrotonyl-CoA carboxylase subunit alpha [Stakelama sp. W311]WNO52918.1 acetyl/propionyl/methylcrotonyl-CoA carboxylase subunit alpha [Stakelama sp. W311]
MIRSLLIANRGEIACRIIRTARALGIHTVAVYSDADAHAMHVRDADEAVHIGPSAAAESYLVGERVIAAAKETGAQAINPGYGFLSENADFADAVSDAGLVWVGPSAKSIRAMGLKDAAKKLMQEAGVPTTPGYLGEDQSPDVLKREADRIGYPVLIKAVAGGGGKGMRRVDDAAEFADMLTSCKREAASSFGDDRVLIEKYILSPRHIEVQIFGDTHGNVVHLFERDCSLQRRHQKVIEEAPAPGMSDEARAEICAAAVRAAKAVDYVGAGTIEFIADASEGLRGDRTWFMEMNTRLQVEHPVTEAITGQDLVEWQLRIASGEPLPCAQDELTIEGHAIEARLYAEDPASGFLPSTGQLRVLDLPHDLARIDAGVAADDRVSPFYDPMIAKMIVHAEDRDMAIHGLADAIDEARIWPVKTNAAFLRRCLLSEGFRTAGMTTGYIGDHIDDLAYTPEPGDAHWRVAAMARGEIDGSLIPEVGAGVWQAMTGFRLNAAPAHRVAVVHRGELRTVDVAEGDDFVAWTIDRDGIVTFEHGNAFLFQTPRALVGAGAASADGAILAPMPGKVIAVEVAEGDGVTKGQKLLTLEAMKMEHSLIAPFDGTVSELNVSVGGQVEDGALLALVEAGNSEP